MPSNSRQPGQTVVERSSGPVMVKVTAGAQHATTSSSSTSGTFEE